MSGRYEPVGSVKDLAIEGASELLMCKRLRETRASMILSRRKTSSPEPARLPQASLAGHGSDAAVRLRAIPHREDGPAEAAVSRWCYQRIPMPDFCGAAMGLTAVDLLQPNEGNRWSRGTARLAGYAGGGTIPKGLNDKANHDGIVKGFEQNIPLAAQHKVPNVITFFGNVQPGMSQAEAIENCVLGLNRVKRLPKTTA
jgi:hypothetical protein